MQKHARPEEPDDAGCLDDADAVYDADDVSGDDQPPYEEV